MKYLSRRFLIAKNLSFPDKFKKGEENLLNPGALDYLIEQVKDDRFFSTIYEKGSSLCFNQHRN